MGCAFGIDIGGTNVRVALVDDQGVIQGVQRARLSGHSVDEVCDLAREALGTLGGIGAGIPIGVGIAGTVRAREGVVTNAPQFGWHDVDLGAALRTAFGHPVRLVNDLSAIAYGEFHVGAGRGARDVVCLFVGSGVGVGVVSAGELLEGADGLAVEFGHVRAVAGGGARLCNCGLKGCIEAYLGGTHLPARLDEVAQELKVKTPVLEGPRDALAIDEAARRGDQVARALWDNLGERLAWAIGSLVMIFNPKVVVLGGGVLNVATSVVEAARSHVGDYAWSSFLVDLEVKPSELGDDAGIVGAALLALSSAQEPADSGARY